MENDPLNIGEYINVFPFAMNLSFMNFFQYSGLYTGFEFLFNKKIIIKYKEKQFKKLWIL